MASSSLVMIFVQHTTVNCPPNSGAKKKHQSESAFTEKKKKKHLLYSFLTANCTLYGSVTHTHTHTLLGFFPDYLIINSFYPLLTLQFVWTKGITSFSVLK